MKTLVKHAKQRRTLPIINTIQVLNGIARATDLDIDIFIPVNMADGLYEPETFGGLNLKSPLDMAYYPQPVDNNKADTFSVSVSLAELEWLAVAMSKEKTRYYLNGIYLDSTTKRLVSIDGHRLHALSSDSFEGKLDYTAIIPSEAIKLAIAACKEKKIKDNIVFTIGKIKGDITRCAISCGDYWIVTKTIDGTYPDYQRVIPDYKGHGKTYAWDNAAYMTAYKTIKTIAKVKNDKTLGVKLDEKLHYFEHSFEFEPCPVTIGFDLDYLADLDTGDMVLRDPSSPVVVQHGQGRMSVLMPMKLS
jgi:DNA polymerase III sliding clamp (beta) subunit (PCNA family)